MNVDGDEFSRFEAALNEPFLMVGMPAFGQILDSPNLFQSPAAENDLKDSQGSWPEFDGGAEQGYIFGTEVENFNEKTPNSVVK